MAAGLGFKDFQTGEVLTAADVDGYLMQGIWVFADATARDAAVTSPQEGNFAFLKDTNTTTYYTGSAWTNLDTTGMVNPMTTTGDTIYSSSGSTPARLGIGTAGQVLRVNSGATAPEWATPAGGGKVLQVVQAISTTSTSVASTSQTDTGLSGSITPSSNTSKILVMTTQAFAIGNSPDSGQFGMSTRLMRDSTQVFTLRNANNAGSTAAIGTSSQLRGVVTMAYLDSPATTSAITYKTQAATNSTANNQSVSFQTESVQESSIIMMEIGA
jgi:hypothetical protein